MKSTASLALSSQFELESGLQMISWKKMAISTTLISRKVNFCLLYTKFFPFHSCSNLKICWLVWQCLQCSEQFKNNTCHQFSILGLLASSLLPKLSKAALYSQYSSMDSSFFSSRQALIVELEILPLTSLLGEIVGAVIMVSGLIPLQTLASLTISPPLRVSSDTIRASMLGYVIVTPKGSFNSKTIVSNDGLIDLMKASIRFILISRGYSSSFNFLFFRRSSPDTPMQIRQVAESAVNSRRT